MTDKNRLLLASSSELAADRREFEVFLQQPWQALDCRVAALLAVTVWRAGEIPAASLFAGGLLLSCRGIGQPHGDHVPARADLAVGAQRQANGDLARLDLHYFTSDFQFGVYRRWAEVIDLE